MRPFANLVACCCVLLGVVASVCTPQPTRTQQLPASLGQQCWELLRPFAHHCQHGRNNSQHSWSNNAGSYCVRLRVAYHESSPTIIASNLHVTSC